MEEEVVNKKAEEDKKKKRTSLKSILGGDILATDFFRRQTKLLVDATKVNYPFETSKDLSQKVSFSVPNIFSDIFRNVSYLHGAILPMPVLCLVLHKVHQSSIGL